MPLNIFLQILVFLHHKQVNIFIFGNIPKTDQFYFVYHPSKYTNNKTALEGST